MEVDVNIFRNTEQGWMLVDVRSFSGNKMMTADLIIIDLKTGLPIQGQVENIDEYDWERVDGVIL